MSIWTRLLNRLRGRRPRCEWAHLTTTWVGDVKVYIERCTLDADHPGAHAPGIPTRVTSDEEIR